MAAAPAETPNENGNAPELNPPPGVILPPKDLRVILEKTVGYIGRNGPSFEDRIRQNVARTPKLSFINEGDPYNAYFRWRLEEFRQGRGTALATGREGDTPVPVKQEKKGPEAPPEFEFSARMPNMSAVDLEVVKLTALFVAKNGRSWMTTLSQRETGNYQFDFLRPQHSFYQFFSRLVDQYTALLNGDSVDGGKPQKKRIQDLEHNVKDKYHVLERARKRAEWVKYQEAQKVRKEEEDEAEKVAYAQIDWHDFTVVETIVFTEADDQIDLPPPTSLNDLQSASLEQKAQMSLARPDMRIEEAMPDEQFYNPQQAYTPQPPPSQQHYMPSPAPQPSMSPAGATGPYAPPPLTPAQQEEEALIAQRMAERERAQHAQAAAKGTGPMRIRNDYVPRAQARRQNVPMAICPNCRQQFPADQMQEHIRIEMLDPNWRTQAALAAQRASTTNLSTADVANNLKRLASQRSDVFDPVTGNALSGDDHRRKRQELAGMNGAPAPGMVGAGAAGAQAPTDVNEQIRQLHQRYGQQGQGQGR
ncbi:SF3a splicing factor complex subunit [Zalaria obscura]|uniref:SF3a splicing factor complex subunit n=1 Tax=Zalaria obscura TaxID=2024903 RepID=A0ACC3S8Y4_9PEZI